MGSGEGFQHKHTGVVEVDATDCASGYIDGFYMTDMLAPFKGWDVEITIRGVSAPQPCNCNDFRQEQHRPNCPAANTQTKESGE